jgi:serine/threonine protein kinase
MADTLDYAKRKKVGRAAESEVKALASKSKLTRLDDQLSKLSWDDIQIDSPIGYGGFSQVFKVQLDNVPEEQGQYFALKCLHANAKVKTKSFLTGAVDLAIEAEILSRLHHENVIQLHGISSAGPIEAYMDTDRGYFLVLDLLQDTWQNRLDKYRLQRSMLRRNGHSSQVLERVSKVAIGIAKGMEYLHSQGVALRDLKPDNVGFDKNGTPKIFDLGFAREAHTIKPTEIAGSLRYMAPEVALGRGSQLESDVYSFGVLLWELCTLEKPYKHITTRDDFMEEVILGDWRQSTLSIQSTCLRRLIKRCWHRDPRKRPTFTKIVKVLRVETVLTNSVPSDSSTRMAFGSGNALRKINTWTAEKLAPRSWSFNRSSFSKGTADTVSTSADEQQQELSSQKNATFEAPTNKRPITKKLSSVSSFGLLPSLNQSRFSKRTAYTDEEGELSSQMNATFGAPKTRKLNRSTLLDLPKPKRKSRFHAVGSCPSLLESSQLNATFEAPKTRKLNRNMLLDLPKQKRKSRFHAVGSCPSLLEE